MSEFKHIRKNAVPALSGIIALAILLAIAFGASIGTSNGTAYADDLPVLSAADIYEQNVGSTVGITTSAQTLNYWGYPTTRSASGSGFIITDSGYILTNYHVIEDSDKVQVATYDGKTHDATVIGYDSSNDVAVLKIEAEGLVPVKIGNSDALRVGDDVFAIGNPLGELTFSLTRGVVSALSRDVRIESGVSMSLIQTDCAINSGNSGGALFNTKGEVIGITNAKYSSSSYGASIDNIGFAIPINTLVRIYESIIENGYILKPYIGISGQTLTDDIMQITGLEGGVRVAEITEEGPAEAAGLKPGDIITEVNGETIKVFNDLSGIVDKSDPDDELALKVYRQGQMLDITVSVGSKIQEAINEKDEDTNLDIPEDYNPYGDSGKGNGGNGGNYYGGNGGGNYYGGMEDFFNDFFFGGRY